MTISPATSWMAIFLVLPSIPGVVMLRTAQTAVHILN